jgi:hypothetical protein
VVKADKADKLVKADKLAKLAKAGKTGKADNARNNAWSTILAVIRGLSLGQPAASLIDDQ